MWPHTRTFGQAAPRTSPSTSKRRLRPRRWCQDRGRISISLQRKREGDGARDLGAFGALARAEIKRIERAAHSGRSMSGSAPDSRRRGSRAREGREGVQIRRTAPLERLRSVAEEGGDNGERGVVHTARAWIGGLEQLLEARRQLPEHRRDACVRLGWRKGLRVNAIPSRMKRAAHQRPAGRKRARACSEQSPTERSTPANEG